MTIKNKLTIGTTFLTLFSTIIACISLDWLASQSSTEALQAEATKQLIASRETSKNRIEQYFEQINNQTLSFANDRMIIAAMSDFKTAVNELAVYSSELDTQRLRTQLNKYYSQDFTKEYQKQNTNKSIDSNVLLSVHDKKYRKLI